MDQLLSGKFEYEEPQLLFSREKISVTLEAGEMARGEVYFGTEKDVKIRGYITSSSRRLVPGASEFSGTTICLTYEVNVKGLEPGTTETGWICFTSNIGEYRLPFEIIVKKAQVQNSEGEVSGLDAFVQVAEKDFRDAFRMFTSDAFSSVLEKESEHEKNLYTGLSRQPVTYQHLEEFLIASGKKEAVQITLDRENGEYYEIKEDMQESFTISRSGWGHLRLELESHGDFIELSRRVVTDEDFIGSRYQVTFLIRKDRLGSGCRYGRIIIHSPYGKLAYLVAASTGSGLSIQVSSDEKRRRAGLLKDYIEYRTGLMNFKTWAEKTEQTVKSLTESGYDYPEYHMFYAFVLHLANRDDEAIKILAKYVNKSFQKEDLELAGVYLYLCTLTGLYTDVEQAVFRVQNFYRQKSDSFLLLYVLLRMDQEYRNSPSRAIFMLEEQYEKGCNSPLLYLEAWKYLKEDQDFLRRLTPFWCHVFLFAGKRGLLSKDMVLRMAYLSGYEKTFSTWMYRALSIGYELYPCKDTLEAVCKYIMQGDPRKPEYFKWYALAVDQGVRLTRIYEYYIETMDASYKSVLPKQVLVYFSYNTNTLSDARRAFLYANIVSHKNSDLSVYAGYRERIRKFAGEKLVEGRMGEYYAVLYQEFFEEPDTEKDAELLSKKMFTNRLYCDDKKIRSITVQHPQLKEEESYPLVQGIAYPRIYTSDAVILFQDDKQRRYVSTVAYSIQPLMDENRMTEAVLDYEINEPGVLLHYCENEEISEDNLEIFHRLVAAEALSESYKKEVRKKILKYYAEHVEEDTLDHGLRNLDHRTYAEVDKSTVLELLISRGMYPEAMLIVREFGCEGVDGSSVLKLVSRTISRGEYENEDELLAYASQVYAEGKFDEVILKYLMDHRWGSMDDLFSLWKHACGFDMDTFELEEKILGLLMLTSDFRKEGETILESYVKQSGKERVIGSYLTLVAYGCFVKEYPISPFIRKCLEYAYKNQWPVNRICHFALLKTLSKEKDPSGKYLEMKKTLLEECMKEQLIFSFYRKLPAELLSPYQLDDKTFVEYHAAPNAKVTICYALDNGFGTEGTFHAEILRDEYEGIFVRTFTLFYGETLRYYFVVEENGKSRKTSERTLTMKHVEGTSGSKYQMINRILAARMLDKDRDVIANLKQYLRQEQYVQEMFRLEEEE